MVLQVSYHPPTSSKFSYRLIYIRKRLISLPIYYCIFSSLKIAEYHGALDCKIQKNWNLHNAAKNLNLDFESSAKLSSISGVVV